MIRSGNARLDVGAIQAAAETASGDGDERRARLTAQIRIRTIETQLAHAEERSAPREQWPQNLRFFPFGSRAVQAFALRVLRLAFRDQHEVNAALVRSAREALLLAQGLAERIEELEARLDRERAEERSRTMARRERDDAG